jgi:hypothetical protein
VRPGDERNAEDRHRPCQRRDQQCRLGTSASTSHIGEAVHEIDDTPMINTQPVPGLTLDVDGVECG